MSLERVIQETKIYLLPYLESQNIDVSASGALRCIHPDHPDNSASAQVNTRGGSEYIYCNSCHMTADIFTAATILEDLPDGGIAWIEDNVLALAKRFDVKFDSAVSYTHQDPKFSMALRAFRDAELILGNSKPSKKAQAYIDEHSWSANIVGEFGLGSIDGTKLTNALMTSGYDSEFLDEIGLIDHRLFHEDNLVFPIQDEWGRTVGFTARSFGEGKKYINSSGVSTYSPYRKGGTLFNSHRARKMTGPLYVFEGQTDVVTAHGLGLRAVSVQGTNLSQDHVTLLNKTNAPKIILCPDGDDAGRKALVKKFIPHALEYELHPIPHVALLTDDEDPDNVLRAGKELPDPILCTQAYSELLEDKPSEERLCEDLIKMSANYTSPIARSVLSRSISALTSIAEAAIFARLDEIDKNRIAEVDERRQQIITDAVKDLSKKPRMASQILVNTMDNLQRVTHSQDALSSDKFLAYLKDIKGEEEDRDGSKPGFTVNGFPGLQKVFNGDCLQKFVIIGGSENTGKSTLADALTYNIVSNPVNDAMLIALMTDDSVRERLPRYICLADREKGKGSLTYLDITNPRYSYDAAKAKAVSDAREAAYQRFYALCMEERIILKDIRDGADIDFLKAMVRFYRSKYPNRKIVAVVDSINRLRAPYGVSDPRSVTTFFSNSLKEISVRYDAMVMGISEFNRPLNRDSVRIIWPTNNRLAESRALEFDSNAILLIYNDVHSRGEDRAEIFWRDPSDNIRPRNVIDITKNKITRFKGKLFYDFDERRAAFREVDIAKARQEWAQEQANKKENEEDSTYSSAVGGDTRTLSTQQDHSLTTSTHIKASIVE